MENKIEFWVNNLHLDYIKNIYNILAETEKIDDFFIDNVIINNKKYKIFLENNKLTINCDDKRKLELTMYFNYYNHKDLLTSNWNDSVTNSIIDYKIGNSKLSIISDILSSTVGYYSFVDIPFEKMTYNIIYNIDEWKKIKFLHNDVDNEILYTNADKDLHLKIVKEGFVNHYFENEFLISKDGNNLFEIENYTIDEIMDFNCDSAILKINNILIENKNNLTDEIISKINEILNNIQYLQSLKNNIINYKRKQLMDCKEAIIEYNNLFANLDNYIFNSQELEEIIQVLKEEVKLKNSIIDSNNHYRVKSLIKRLTREEIDFLKKELNK